MTNEFNRAPATRRNLSAAALLLITLAVPLWLVQSRSAARLAHPAEGKRSSADVATALGRLPLSFEPNRGQTDSSVRFVTRGAGYSVFLTEKEAVIQLKKAKSSGGTTVAMRFAGAQKPSSITPSNKQEGISNYYIGSRSNWVTGLPNYGQVHYKGIYPGVDAVFYGQGTKLRYDVIVNKGGDPKAVALNFDGATGASLNGKGDLVLKTAGGDLVYDKPVIYQEIAGVRHPVQGGYRLLGGEQVGFDVAGYDRNETLVIDPVINFSTYLGGTLADQVNAVFLNPNTGSVLVAGQTSSLTFPISDAGAGNASSGTTAGVAQIAKNALQDAFVANLNATGTTRMWATYYGGSLNDSATALTATVNGVLAVGSSNSPDLPLNVNPSVLAGTHGFALFLNLNGGLVWSTRVGGTTGTDTANAVAVDLSVGGTGDFFVAGTTSSTDLNGRLGGDSPTLQGSQDGFITRLTAGSGVTTVSTYVGGLGVENINSIAARNGIVTVGGDTTSVASATAANGKFPSVPATQTAGFPIQIDNAGGQDGFLMQIGAALTPGATFDRTYVGGPGTDSITAVANRNFATAEFKIWFAGTTNSAGIATTNAAQATLGGGNDGFVGYWAENGTLGYLTYLGGVGNETVTGLAVDSVGQAYVVGSTASAGLAVTTTALQATLAGASDGLLARVAGPTSAATDGLPNGSVINLLTYFGGAGNDSINGIALSANGPTIYFGGMTDGGAGLITSPGAYRTTPTGGNDGFVSSYAFNDLTIVSPAKFTVANGGAAQTANLTLTFSNGNNAYTIGAIADTAAPTTGAVCTGWLTAANNGNTTIAITVDPKKAGCAPATGLKATFPVTAGADNGAQVVTVTLDYTATSTAPTSVTRWFSKGTTTVTKGLGPNPPQPVAAANTVTGNVDTFLVQSVPAGLPFTPTLAFNGTAAQKAACAGVISVTGTGPTATTGTNVAVTYAPASVGDLLNLIVDNAAPAVSNPSCQGTITYKVAGAPDTTQNVSLDFTSQLLTAAGGPTISNGLSFAFNVNTAGQSSTQNILVQGDAFRVGYSAAFTALAFASGNAPLGTCNLALSVAAPNPPTAPDTITDALLTPSNVAVTVDPSIGPCTLGNTYTGRVTLTPTTPATGGNPISFPVTVVVGDAISVAPTAGLNLGFSTATDTTPPASQTATINTTIPSLPFTFSVTASTLGVGPYTATAAQATGSQTGWLRVTPGTGDTTTGAVTLTASVDPTVWAGLAGSAGGTVYGGTVTVTSTSATTAAIPKNMTASYPVSFTKFTAPLVVAEAATVGGTFGTASGTPAALSFTITQGTGIAVQSQAIQPTLTAGYAITGTDFTVDAMTVGNFGYAGFGFPSDATAAKVTTFTGGQNANSWLTVVPTKGASGASVTVSANLNNNLVAQNLTAPVVFTGTVRVRHLDKACSTTVALICTPSESGQNPVTIPVTFTVNPQLSLNLSSTATQNFAYTLGTPTTPAPITVTATSSLTATAIPFTVTPTVTAAAGNPTNCAWLTATPAAGSATTGSTITIGVNSACITGTTPALAPATYTGNVAVGAPSASVQTQNIPVTLIVTALPVISVAPSTTAGFSTQINATTGPADKVLQVNVSSGTIPLTLAPAATPAWLVATLSPTAPTPASSALLNLSINQTAVNALTAASTGCAAVTGTAGTFTCSQALTVGSTTANVAPVTVTVNLTVSGAASLSVGPATASFTYTLGNTTASTPLCTVPAVSVTGSANGLVVTPVITTTSGGSAWIAAPTLTGGTTPTQATICVVPSLLTTVAAGVYTGAVTFTSPGANPAPVAVTLTVNAQPVVTAPATAAYAYTWGGTAPAAQNIAVSSTPAGATGLVLTSTGDCTWITSALAGTTAPTTINTAVKTPQTKAPGTYACTLILNGTGGSPSAPAVASSTVVTLTVTALPFFSAATNGGGGTLFETLPGGNLFGYFAYLGSNNILFHLDLGYEVIVAANDASNGIYMFDFASGHWWYTNATSFPFVYDFTLGAWIYYFPAQANPGHYTTNPRQFVNVTTGKFFSM